MIPINRRYLASFGIRHVLRAMVRSGILARHRMWGIPIDRTIKLSFPRCDAFLYRVWPGDLIGEDFYWCGANSFQPEVTPEFIKAVKRARRILDVGAYTGLYSLIACAANQEVTVMTFEPVPRLCDATRRNIGLNRGFLERCAIFQAAASNVNGCATFYLPDDSTMGSLHATIYPEREKKPFEVQTVRIDDLVAEDQRIDVVKIDVEGFEAEALGGMEKLIKRSHPQIFFEVIRQWPAADLERILKSHGYRLYHLTPQGPVGVDRLEPPRDSKFDNFMAV